MSGKRALALVNVIIFAVIFSMLAGTLLITVSSQARLLESSITRTKALYLVEANLVWCLDYMYANGGEWCPANPAEGITWEYSTDDSVVPVSVRTIDNFLFTLSTEYVPGTMDTISTINSTYEYTFPW